MNLVTAKEFCNLFKISRVHLQKLLREDEAMKQCSLKVGDIWRINVDCYLEMKKRIRNGEEL